ncbi:MAG: choice-of-anchor L domain-containing protein [Proteobacteria bacterium]|nr:choice-of-anchor L domain-containing protein [Pseudomonadota bacterium]
MKSKLILCLQCCLFAALAVSCGDNDASNQPPDPGQNCTKDNEMMCGDVCVDVKSNAEHCGNCETVCNKGEYCDAGSCKKGELTCNEDKGEMKCGDTCVDVTANPKHCGTCNHKCGTDEICVDKTCQKQGQEPECKAEEGKALCDNKCIDITENIYNCGKCDFVCGSNMKCQNKACTCEDGYYPVSDDVAEGCDILLGDECNPGESRECWTYNFEPAEDSACKKGTQHCVGGAWESCENQVGPLPYNPDTPEADLNCDGTPDKDEDADGDGWTKGDGDCCDDLDSCTASTEGVVKEQDLASINPGAAELPDDKVDNNCNGKVDESPSASCEHGIDDSFPTGVDDDAALALARAMDICDEVVTKDSRKPGLISATLLNGMKEISIHANSLFSNAMGTEGTPYKLRPVNNSASFAVLSTGKAIDAAHFTDQTINSKEREVATSGQGTIPKLYSQSDPNFRLQSNALCGTADKIFDVAALTTEMRVPSNAKGFRVKFRFFTSEYSEYVCKPFNDFFVILLESTHEDTPKDHNIAFDLNHNPISVNNAFFTSCVPLDCDKNQCPAIMTCDANTEGHKVCKPKNAKGELIDPCSDGDEGRLAASTFNTYTVGRGATSWLETSASVVGGEVIKLHFYIWDTGDSSHDSLVILDDFQWVYEDVELGTLPVVIN